MIWREKETSRLELDDVLKSLSHTELSTLDILSFQELCVFVPFKGRSNLLVGKYDHILPI